MAAVAPYTSKETIAKSNPLVEDYNQELKYQKEDLQSSDGFSSSKSFDNTDDYSLKAMMKPLRMKKFNRIASMMNNELTRILEKKNVVC